MADIAIVQSLQGTLEVANTASAVGLGRYSRREEEAGIVRNKEHQVAIEAVVDLDKVLVGVGSSGTGLDYRGTRAVAIAAAYDGPSDLGHNTAVAAQEAYIAGRRWAGAAVDTVQVHVLDSTDGRGRLNPSSLRHDDLEKFNEGRKKESFEHCV